LIIPHVADPFPALAPQATKSSSTPRCRSTTVILGRLGVSRWVDRIAARRAGCCPTGPDIFVTVSLCRLSRG
jgi:hypothetical protein